MKNINIKRSVFLLLTAAILAVTFSGCGIYKGWVSSGAIEEATEKMEQARQQEADRYAPGVFDQGSNQIAQAQQAREAKEYDQAISAAENAVSTFERAIQAVPRNKQMIQQKQAELQNIRQQLREILQKAEASEFRAAAEGEIAEARTAFDAFSNEVDRLLNQRAQVAEEYDELIAQSENVRSAVQRAYNLTLADQANELNNSIEEKLNQLSQLDYQEYIPDRAAEIDSALNRFRTAIENQAYESAIATGETLAATMEQSIPVARRTRAITRVSQAEQRLAEAAAMGAVEDAPQQMDAARQALAEAKAAVEQQNYDQAFNSAEVVISNCEVAFEEIKAKIESRNEQIRQQLSEAEAVGAETHAPSQLERSRQKLAEAFNATTEGNYAEARAAQQQALAAAEMAYTIAQEGRAEVIVNRIDEVLTRARNQGAVEYVGDSFSSAVETFNEAKALLRQDKYDEFHKVAEKAEQQANQVMNDLIAANEKKITEANNQVEAAREAGATQYAPELFQQAGNALEQARQKKAADAYLESFRRSEAAIQTGREAERKTYRLRTDELMIEIKEQRELAQESGAREHSSEMFLTAVRNTEESQQAYSEGRYYDALRAAQKAEEGFRTARMSKIIRAENAVDSAVEAKAHEYAPEPIATAESLLSQAKTAMDNREYESSNTQADQAYAKATEAEKITWNIRSENLIAEWQQRFAKAKEDFAETKAPEPLEQSETHAVEARAEFAVSNFHSAYKSAVKAMEALDRTNQKLAQEATKTLEMMRSESERIGKLAMDATGREMQGQLIALIAIAEPARQNENWNKVFSTENQFEQTLDQVETQLKVHNLTSLKNQVQDSLTQAQQKGTASFLPEKVEQITQQLNDINPTANVENYEETRQELLALQEEVDQFPAYADAEIESRIARMREQLNEARLAGALEVNPELYADAVESYKAVLTYPRGEETDYNELFSLVQTASEKSENTFESTTLAVDVRDYRDLLSSYLTEMQSLLDSFSPVTDYSKRFHIAAESSRQVNVYREMQPEIQTTALRRRANLLLERAQEITPPPTQEHLHQVAMRSFREFVEMAKLFEHFGDYEKYDRDLRELYIAQAYESLERLKKNNSALQNMLAGTGTAKVEQKVTLDFWDYLKSTTPGVDARF